MRLPPKKGRTGLVIGLIAGAVILLCVCGGIVVALTSGNDKDAAEPTGPGADTTQPAERTASGSDATQPPEPQQRQKAPGTGVPVRDGKFEFVVTSVQCGKTRVGGDVLNATAQGQYCLVTMNIKNIGNEAQIFDASSQKAKNAAGQVYSADGTASLYANQDSQAFLNQINPGNQVSGGIVVFDVPKDQKVTKLELHDSPFSGGVEVTVG
jgi:hypothetical protein